MENIKQLPKSFFEKTRPHATNHHYGGKIVETKFSEDALKGKRKVTISVKKSK